MERGEILASKVLLGTSGLSLSMDLVNLVAINFMNCESSFGSRSFIVPENDLDAEVGLCFGSLLSGC